jgi:hypothetical protein
MSRPFVWCSISAGASVAIIVGEILTFAPPPVRSVHFAMPSRTATHAAAYGASEAEHWASIALGRPIFQDDRRPSSEVEIRPGSFARLAGVITGRHGSYAIFTSGNDGKSVVVNVGVRIGNLLVRSIQPGLVTVEVAGNLRILHPVPADAAPAPMPADRIVAVRTRAG